MRDIYQLGFSHSTNITIASYQERFKRLINVSPEELQRYADQLSLFQLERNKEDQRLRQELFEQESKKRSESLSFFSELSFTEQGIRKNPKKIEEIWLGAYYGKEGMAKLLRRNAMKGDSFAQFCFGYLQAISDSHGLCCTEGSEYIIASQKSIERYAEQGDPQAQWALGSIFYHGLGLRCRDNDPFRAKVWFKKAADQGHAIAKFRLGTMDDSLDIELVEQAATLNFAPAMMILVHYYASTIPLSELCFLKENEKIVTLLRQAVELGYLPAYRTLADLYKTRLIACSNPLEKEFELLQFLVGQGAYDSSPRVGDMYRQGKGVEKNIEKALVYFYQYADLGCPRTQFTLGEVFENGETGIQDIKQAIFWYGKAFQQEAKEDAASKALERLRVDKRYEKEIVKILERKKSETDRRLNISSYDEWDSFFDVSEGFLCNNGVYFRFSQWVLRSIIPRYLERAYSLRDQKENQSALIEARTIFKNICQENDPKETFFYYSPDKAKAIYASMLFNGEGGEKDIRKARDIYEKVRDFKSILVQEKLFREAHEYARMLFLEEGDKQNLQKAKDLYELCWENGQLQDYFCLGLIYRQCEIGCNEQFKWIFTTEFSERSILGEDWRIILDQHNFSSKEKNLKSIRENLKKALRCCQEGVSKDISGCNQLLPVLEQDLQAFETVVKL